MPQKCPPQGARAGRCCAACGSGEWPGASLWSAVELCSCSSAARGQPVDAFADASDVLLRGLVLGMPLQQRLLPPWPEAYAALQLPRLNGIAVFFWLATAAWCAAVHGGTAVLSCAVVADLFLNLGSLHA